MTQLDRQLSRIQERAHRVDTSKYRDSLLFDAKEAAAIDYEAVLVIGQEGLKELIRLDQRFKEFESNIFAPSSRSHNRMMITTEEADQLDSNIHSFLRLAGSYFLLNPAQKALEWLIRRYRINEFNIDSLILSVIPYHQSNTFAKLVSILRFERNGKWSFLTEAKKNKISITRDFFVKLMKKNSFFAESLCNAIMEYENNSTLSKTMISFFTALLIDLVSSSKIVPEHFNRVALPCLNYSIKSKNIELQLGAFMILGNIASKVQFSNEAIELLIRSTLKNCQGSLMASFTFLLVLFQKQKIDRPLSVTTLEMLVNTPALQDILLELHQQNRSLDQFIQVSLKYLLDTYAEKTESFDLLYLFVTDLPATQSQYTTIVSSLLKQYLLNNNNSNNSNNKENSKEEQQVSSGLNLDLMRKIIRAIDPSIVQIVINSCTEGDQARLTEFQSSIFAQKFLSKSKANELFLRLVSPSIQARLEGVQQLGSLQNTGTNIDWRSFSNTVCALLIDSDSKVLEQTWSLPNLLEIVSIEKLVESMQRSISIPSLAPTIKKSIIDRMSIEFNNNNNNNDNQQQQQKQIKLFTTLSQFLLNTQHDNGSHKWIVEYLVKDSHPLFQGVKPSEFNNFNIITTLGDNILKNNNNLLHTLIENAFSNSDDTLLPNDKLLLLLISSYSLPKLKNASDRIKLSNIILQFSINYLSSNNIKSANNNIFSLEELCQLIETNFNPSVPALVLALTIDSLMISQQQQKENNLIDQIKSFNKQQDQSTSLYLEFISNLFIASITMSTNNANLSTLLIQNLITKILENNEDLLKFLSFIWSDNQQPDIVRQASLSICNSFMTSKRFYEIAHSQCLLPSLLLGLLSESSEIRVAVCQCIGSIDAALTKCSSKSIESDSASAFANYTSGAITPLEAEQYNTLVHLISDYNSEFRMSEKFFRSFVGSVLLSSSTKTFSSKEREQIGSYLVSSALALDNPTQRSQLMAALSEIREPYVFNICNNYITELLQKCQTSTINFDETIVLDVLIEQLVQIPVLNSKKGHLPTLLKALDITSVVKITNTRTYCVIESVEKRLTHEVLVGLAHKDQGPLLEKLLDLLQSDESSIRDSTLECLNNLLIDTNSILSVLSIKSKGEKVLPTITRLKSLMGIIRNNASKIKDVVMLLGSMFSTLKLLITASTATDNTNSDNEYSKQLTLLAITSIIDSLISTESRDLESVSQMIDLSVILNSISKSEDGQTCNYGLLLIAKIAKVAPTNVVDKFDEIIQMIKVTVTREDNQTYLVLKRFLADTLPVLLKAGGITLTSVFRMFIKAFDDIPKQNRVDLFSMMIQSIEYSKLVVFLTLTMEKRIEILRKETLLSNEIGNGMQIDEEENDKSKQSESELFNEFVTAVTNKIPAVPMSLALSILSQAVNTITLDNATVDSNQEYLNDQLEEIVKLFDSSSSKDNRLIQANILDFIDERLSATTYLEDLSFRVDSEQRQEIEQYYLDAFSALLVLLRGITESIESLKSDPAAKKGREKYLKKLLSSVNRCMDRYNQLLSIDGFVISVSKLLHHPDPQVRRRSLVIFNEKITALKNKLTNEQILKFLSLLNEFAKVIESQTENDTNKQTALLSFEILARNFAIKHSNVFLKQMPTIINAMGSGSYMVVSSSLICIATLCSELQSKTVPHIPQFFPVLLNTLTGSFKSTEESETRSLLQLSCISSLEMMLKKIPKFLSPYLPQMLNALLHPRLTATSSKVFTQVKKILTLLTKNIEFRLLLPAMTSAYEFAVVSESDQSLICLFDFVGDISNNLIPKDVALYHKAIFKFFLQCFDFRRKHSNKVKNIDEVENHIISSFITLIMKLNEVLFKPLFLKISDWAIQPQQQQQQNKKKKSQQNGNDEQTEQLDINNTLFFYKLVDSLSANLKSIFVPYLSYFLDNAIHHLETLVISTPNSQQLDDGIVLTNGKRKKSATNGKHQQQSLEINSSILVQEDLLCNIISSIQKCLSYDKDGFLDKQKFEKLVPALVNQLENQMGTEESYRNRVEKYIVPCITQLTVTINQEMLWKSLNHAVLMKTRNPYANVRLSAISVIQSLHKRLGERLLIHLPETIPFISELLEDSVPEVEKQCQELVKIIENHLGTEESISSYL